MIRFCYALVFFLVAETNALGQPFSRAYECVQGQRCQRTARPIAPGALGPGQHSSLAACRLVCLPAAGLWPVPTGLVSTSSNYVGIDPGTIQYLIVNEVSKEARNFLSNATRALTNNLYTTCGHDCRSVGRRILVHLNIESSSLELGWETNESYGIDITTTGNDVSAIVQARTVYGARHGLETLLQLTARTRPGGIGEGSQLVILDTASVRDKPVFPHRGLLIDTSRNFLPVRDVLRTVDGLAAAKMNVLHWHATDSQSFPLEIKSQPLMAVYGAYGPDKIYSTEDLEMIVKYAKSKGVRVILEIDSPSHAGAGWEWGESEGLGNLAVCINQQPWRDYCIQPPCGQLNPVNPNTFYVLKNIYKELLNIFGRNGMIHLGGDELFINCWNSTQEVITGMAKLGLGRSIDDFLKIWSSVHNKQWEILNEESKNASVDKVIIWSSQLTSPEIIEKYLNKTKFIVQTWVEADRDLNKKLLDLGYKLIISTKDAWYLDHGFWGITKYHTWRDAYKNQIPQNPGVLGGEACMWGEYISSGSLDSRVWPRTAAVAERLWSDPSKISTGEAEPRLQAHIERMKQRQILAEAIAPEWCNQHEGQCL